MKNEIVLCACGCGECFERFNAKGRPRRYLPRHYQRQQWARLEQLQATARKRIHAAQRRKENGDG